MLFEKTSRDKMTHITRTPSKTTIVQSKIRERDNHAHSLLKQHPTASAQPEEHDPRDPGGHFSNEFDHIDLDHDDYLSHEELRNGLISQKWEQREVDELFSLIDLDRDRRISRDEYISFRSSIIFDAFAIRTSRKSSVLTSKDYVPLDPKSRDLCARSAISLSLLEEPGSTRPCKEVKCLPHIQNSRSSFEKRMSRITILATFIEPY